ncbi:hypothetical protein SSBG_02694 [Streptomyces sp. SPB074]|nr:hypothetical protein SSBG_02694 [Streptomyces sp. SPB074]
MRGAERGAERAVAVLRVRGEGEDGRGVEQCYRFTRRAAPLRIDEETEVTPLSDC